MYLKSFLLVALSGCWWNRQLRSTMYRLSGRLSRAKVQSVTPSSGAAVQTATKPRECRTATRRHSAGSVTDIIR